MKNEIEYTGDDMNKENMIAMCKYYNGEKDNPFDGEDQNKAALWFYERSWVFGNLGGDDFSRLLSDYLYVGLFDFKTNDHTHIEYKALLFNRLTQGSQSMEGAVTPFKEFYNKYY